MRVPSVAVMAALLAVAHAAPGQQLPPTPEIVRMFAEAADRVDEAEISDSFESSSAEDLESASNQAKRSYAVHPPAKQFCIEIRPKNPSQSPFVICEPPTQPYYQYPQPQNPYPYPHQPAPSYLPAPSAYPAHPAYPGPSAYPPPGAPPPPPNNTGGKPYQRTNSMTSSADATPMTMNSGLRANNPDVAPMQQPHHHSPPPVMMPPGHVMTQPMPPPGPVMAQPMPPQEPVMTQPMPPHGPVMAQPMPPASSGRSNYPPPYVSYDQPPPMTMQCHAQPGYQTYHGYQNPVALLQLFLKPSHHHHHHPGYYSAPAATPTEVPSYRAAGVEVSAPKKNATSSAAIGVNQTTASDNSTEGPLRIPIPIPDLHGAAAHPPMMTNGPHITPAGSHPESKDIPGITSPGSPNPMFRPGGGAALLQPSNASKPTLTAPKMAGADDDDSVNMVDGPKPMGRSNFNSAMMPPQSFDPVKQWMEHQRSVADNDRIMPENHVISGQIAVPIHSDMSPINGVL